MNDFALFLGRFHPLMVHLPIGILMLAMVIEWLGRKEKYAALAASGPLILLLGALSAVVSALLGLLLAQGGDYDTDLLTFHQNLGIAVAVLSLLLYVVRRNEAWMKGWAKQIYLPASGLMVLLLIVAGHQGGSLTHGEDYLLQYAPSPVKRLAGLEEAPDTEAVVDIQTADVYAALVEPILKKSCVSCHNKSKRKGGLRMDTREELLKGGENGVIFVAGNTEKSELFRRLNLPMDDEKHMPPDGKKPLTEAQVSLIGWWIGIGAPMDKKLSELEVPADIQAIIAKMGVGGAAKKASLLDSLKVAPPDAAAIEKLKSRKAQARPLAEGSSLLQITLSRDSLPFGDADMTLLKPLTEQIVWLDLRMGAVKDFSGLAQLTHLNRLTLAQTAFSDKDMVHLAGLSQLEYLNLYGTQVSDEGIRQLAGLKNLKNLYLWQTKVTEAGIAALKQSLPGLAITMGEEMKEVEPVTTQGK